DEPVTAVIYSAGHHGAHPACEKTAAATGDLIRAILSCDQVAALRVGEESVGLEYGADANEIGFKGLFAAGFIGHPRLLRLIRQRPGEQHLLRQVAKVHHYDDIESHEG